MNLRISLYLVECTIECTLIGSLGLMAFAKEMTMRTRTYTQVELGTSVIPSAILQGLKPRNKVLDIGNCRREREERARNSKEKTLPDRATLHNVDTVNLIEDDKLLL